VSGHKQIKGETQCAGFDTFIAHSHYSAIYFVCDRYIAHAEGAVRASACDALMGTIRGCPMLRGLVLSNMAAFLASVPDEAVQVMNLLKMKCLHWHIMFQPGAF
jgi:hypothetical protein